MLLLSNLSARATCSVVPYSIQPACTDLYLCLSPSYTPGCTPTSCPTGLYRWSYFSPAIDVACSNDREYLILKLSIDPTFIANTLHLPDGVSYLLPYSQSVNFYAEDQWGDLSLAGTGDFKGKTSAEFTVYGSTRYEFTFNNSVFTSFEIVTSTLPNCSVNFGEKILKADNSNSAMYQCTLFVETVGNPPYSGLGGCTPHRCQYYSDKNLVAYCDSKYSDADCYSKAEHVWMIGTEYDLSSLPKVMIYLTMLIIYFLGYIAGFLVLSGA